jgi:hypothetical protein
MFGSALLQRRSWAGSGPSVGHSGLVWRFAAGDGRLQKHDGAAAQRGLRVSVRSPLRGVRRQWPLVPRWLESTNHVCASRVKSHEGWFWLLWRTDVVCSLVMLLSALQSNGCGQCDAFHGVHQAVAALAGRGAESPCFETGIGCVKGGRCASPCCRDGTDHWPVLEYLKTLLNVRKMSNSLIWLRERGKNSYKILFWNNLSVSPLIIFLEDDKNQYKCIYKTVNC